jgi:hypothetical protein
MHSELVRWAVLFLCVASADDLKEKSVAQPPEDVKESSLRIQSSSRGRYAETDAPSSQRHAPADKETADRAAVGPPNYRLLHLHDIAPDDLRKHENYGDEAATLLLIYASRVYTPARGMSSRQRESRVILPCAWGQSVL